MNPPTPDHSLPCYQVSVPLHHCDTHGFESVIHYIFSIVDGGSEPSPGRPPTYVQSEYK